MSKSDTDETVQMQSGAAQHAAGAALPAETDSSWAPTVKIEVPPPVESGLQPTQQMGAPASAPASESQPTVRVQARPIAETRPTIPMPPPAADSRPTLVSPQPQPVNPAPGSGEPPPFIRRGSGLSLPPLSGWTLVVIAGVGVLLVLLGCALTAPSIGEWLVPKTATPTATLTPTTTSTPKPTPTLPPTNTPVPASPTPVVPTNTPRPAPTALEIGVLAKVTPPAGLKLKVRDRAGTGGEVLGELDPGAEVKIIDGPIDANNLKWWKVDNGQGLVGWSAEGVGGDMYLVAVGWAP